MQVPAEAWARLGGNIGYVSGGDCRGQRGNGHALTGVCRVLLGSGLVSADNCRGQSM